MKKIVYKHGAIEKGFNLEHIAKIYKHICESTVDIKSVLFEKQVCPLYSMNTAYFIYMEYRNNN